MPLGLYEIILKGDVPGPNVYGYSCEEVSRRARQRFPGQVYSVRLIRPLQGKRDHYELLELIQSYIAEQDYAKAKDLWQQYIDLGNPVDAWAGRIKQILKDQP